MLEEFGIFNKKDQSRFLYLSVDTRIKGEVISSLQAFETSLMMLGLGRWTNSIVFVANAIEVILREEFPDRDTFVDLINAYSTRYKISNSLKDAAHETRKERNRFVHDAIIPDDNYSAALTFLSKSLSLYKVCLEKSYGIDLYKLIHSEKLVENLKIARDLVKRREANGSNIDLFMTVLVKTIANQTFHLMTPQQLLDDYNEGGIEFFGENYESEFYANYPNDVVADIKDEIFARVLTDQDFISPFEQAGRYSIACPAECFGGSLYLQVAIDDLQKLKSKVFESAKCYKCGLMIIPDTLLEIYVRKLLGKERIDEILKSYGISI